MLAGLSAAALRVSGLPGRTATSTTTEVSVVAGVTGPAIMTTGAATAILITTLAAIRPGGTDARQHQRPASRSCQMRETGPASFFAGPGQCHLGVERGNPDRRRPISQSVVGCFRPASWPDGSARSARWPDRRATDRRSLLRHFHEIQCSRSNSGNARISRVSQFFEV